MRKHILSKFAEKKIVGNTQMNLTGKTFNTDSLENSDVDCFKLNKPLGNETGLTESIEPSDVDGFGMYKPKHDKTELFEKNEPAVN